MNETQMRRMNCHSTLLEVERLSPPTCLVATSFYRIGVFRPKEQTTTCTCRRGDISLCWPTSKEGFVVRTSLLLYITLIMQYHSAIESDTCGEAASDDL